MSFISRTRQGLQTLLQQTQTTGKELVQLSQSCWAASAPRRGGAGGDYKTALLQQAQQHGNRTALRLLLLEKEYGLLKYHGLTLYLQQTAWWNRWRQQLLRMLPSSLSLASGGSSSNSSSRFGSSRFSSNSSRNTISTSSSHAGDDKTKSVGHDDDDDDALERQQSSNNSQDDANNNGVAKVAFMVTGRMKSELGESLGYDASQIRSMSPVEASLVLEHRISPNDYHERIPVLLQEHEEAVALQAAEQQQALRQQLEEEKEKQFAALRPESSSGNGNEQGIRDVMRQPTLEDSGNSQQTLKKMPLPSFELSLPQADSFSSRQDDNEKTPIANSIKTESIPTLVDVENNKSRKWYELVQTSNDDEDSVVGLYRTKEEANFGREVHEELAQGRAKRGDKDAESLSFQIRATVR